MNENQVQKLLLRCLNPTQLDMQLDALNEVQPAQWEELFILAKRQKVTALLYHRLKEHGLTTMLPPQILKKFQRSSRNSAMRNLKLYQELALLLRALQAANIPTLVLKGAHLAKSVYPDPALRFMLDLDLMVHEEHLTTVAEIFSTFGYPSLEPVQVETARAMSQHLPRFVKEDNIAIFEIHWTITSPDKPYTLAVDDLWMHAQCFKFANMETLALCPEDLLLHVCMHATYEHYFLQGVRPLCDIREIVAYHGDTLDWDTFCQRSREWGWTKGTYLVLYLAQTLIGATIPAKVLATLQPDGISPQLIEVAKAHLFSAYGELGLDTSTYFMEVVEGLSYWQFTTLLVQRLAPSRQSLAHKYNIPVDSPRLYLYYPVRFWVLLTRYYRKIWRYLRGDSELKTAAHQRNLFAQWLEQA